MNRKQIAFDIDTKIAEEILGDGYRKIYDDIKKHLVNNGFKHLQGSVYTSHSPMRDLDVTYIIKELLSKYDYLEKCIRDIRKTDITREHSLNHLFSYDGTSGKFSHKETGKEHLKNTKKVKKKQKRGKLR